jgi:hypothetical protein
MRSTQQYLINFILCLEEEEEEEEDESASETERVIGAIHNSDSFADILRSAQDDIGPALRSQPLPGASGRNAGKHK